MITSPSSPRALRSLALILAVHPYTRRRQPIRSSRRSDLTAYRKGMLSKVPRIGEPVAKVSSGGMLGRQGWSAHDLHTHESVTARWLRKGNRQEMRQPEHHRGHVDDPSRSQRVSVSGSAQPQPAALPCSPCSSPVSGRAASTSGKGAKANPPEGTNGCDRTIPSERSARRVARTRS